MSQSAQHTEFDAKASQSKYSGVTTQSLYLAMRDGVSIAVDVMLPRDLPAGAKLPAVLTMTRYWRSFDLRTPAPPAKAPLGPRAPLADILVSNGYAVVVVDARGSGASFGAWPYPWSPDELADYGEVVAWIISQSWSNGSVGAIGISYEGVTAQLLAAVDQPAVKAVVSQMVEFDVYTDVVFPGGILNEWFIATWSGANRDLDRNKVPRSFPWYARFLVRGARPVDDDKQRDRLKQAVASHAANLDVYRAVRGMTYRDDSLDSLPVTPDDFSVFAFKEKIEQSGAAILSQGSWLDGATADAVIRRFVNFSNPQRAVIGAWSHTGEHHASPYARPKSPPNPSLAQQWEESLAFFDRHLKHGRDEGAPDKILFYFTLGEEKWKSTMIWPPAGATTERWYLAEDGLLSPQRPAEPDGADTYAVDFKASTGSMNRWHTEMALPVVYPDRASADRRLLTYTSAPLAEDTEITGYPVVALYVASTASDGAFFVYLEDVDESGKVIYVTEGQLRALHRRISDQPPPYRSFAPHHSFKREDGMPLVPGEVAELTIGLLPTSIVIKKGHRLRIAIAGHDEGTFARIPAQGTPVITVARNTTHASCVDIPVVRGR